MGARITILEDNDKITKDCYCRPLCLSYELSDAVFTTSPYGRPINNMRWAKVTDVLGRYWMNKKVKEYTKGASVKMEFIKGTPPKKHLL